MSAVEPPFIIVQGHVREAGGRVVTIVVDTDYHPRVGAEVAIVELADGCDAGYAHSDEPPSVPEPSRWADL